MVTLKKKILRPFQEFARREASGGILLFGAMVAALIWAVTVLPDRRLVLLHRFSAAGTDMGLEDARVVRTLRGIELLLAARIGADGPAVRIRQVLRGPSRRHSRTCDSQQPVIDFDWLPHPRFCFYDHCVCRDHHDLPRPVIPGRGKRTGRARVFWGLQLGTMLPHQLWGSLVRQPPLSREPNEWLWMNTADAGVHVHGKSGGRRVIIERIKSIACGSGRVEP